MNSKERLRHETLRLIDQCVTLENFVKVTREHAEKTLEELREKPEPSNKGPLYNSNCAHELIRLATACQLSAARFDYELNVLQTCSD